MKKFSSFGMSLPLMFSLFAACSEQPTTSEAKEETRIDTPSQEQSSQAPFKTHIKTQTDSDVKQPTLTRSVGSHTHGDAELGIVRENNIITIAFDTPLYNVLGFEHHPETKAQKETVKIAQDRLQEGEALFVFNVEAECAITSYPVDLTLFNEGTENHRDHHDQKHVHDDDGQDHNHNSDAQNENDHATHKDLILEYEYSCANPASLSNITVKLFEFFKNLSDIDVTYLSRSTQTYVSMTRKNTQMDLSK